MNSYRNLQSYLLISSIVIYIITMFMPIIHAYGNIFSILMMLSVVLFIIAFLFNGKINRSFPFILICIVIFNYMIYKTQWTYYTTLVNKMIMLMQFWYPLLIAMHIFSSKEKITYKKKHMIVHFFIIIYMITAITTIIGNVKYDIPSRYLATSNLDETTRLIYRQNNIGGFGFCYFAIFFILILFYYMKKTRNKIYLIPLIITYIMCIRSQYVILIILMVITSLLAVFDNLSMKKRIITVISMGVIIYLASVNIDTIINVLTQMFDEEEIIILRINEIYRLLVGKTSNYIALSARKDVYIESWNTFISQPLLGNYKAGIGGHSEILDLMGAMGFFGITVILLILNTFYKSIKKINNQFNSLENYYFKIFIFVFIVLGLLNPIFSSRELGFGILLILMSFTSQKKINALDKENNEIS